MLARNSLVLLVTSFLAWLALGCSDLGTGPSEEDRARFLASAQFDKSRSVFRNRIPDVLDGMLGRIGIGGFMEAMFGGSELRVPPAGLPQARPDLNVFLDKNEAIKVIWFGHSSLLINIGGKTVLTDPNFSETASPFGFMIKRFQPPALALADLPPVDFVVISHDHYDHLDMTTVKFFRDRATRFLVPLGIGAHLGGWGIDKERINELDWWQSISLDGLEITATPAQHNSGRKLLDSDRSLWASWLIRDAERSFFFSGDTGYDTYFREIGERYGPVDVAFIESGQYNELWREVHLLPEQSVQAFLDLGAKRLFPVHWAAFNLALHAWSEPINQVSVLAKEKGVDLITPRLGEAVAIDGRYKSTPWWEEVR